MINIVIIWYHINVSKIECLTYSGSLLLNLTKNILKTGGTTNFKILYGLCISQFNKDHTVFKDDAYEEVIAEIEERFHCLINEKIITLIYFYIHLEN